MTSNELISSTISFVKQELISAEGGHDWFHIQRVWKTAKHIAQTEQVNMLIVELGALLHDIADSKFHEGDEEIGPRKAREFLEGCKVDPEVVDHVIQLIRHISFKGGNETSSWSSPELLVVQDADRLDAIGAIGIARAFNYGGHKGRQLYDPDTQPQLTMSKDEYKRSRAPTINHFYEKLLLLRDRMNTANGRKMADERHEFMEHFLEQFYAEWEGVK